jgi:hypothetical protein
MRVRANHHRIYAPTLRSWVVEGSLDGEPWMEIDRRRGSKDFKVAALPSR